MKITKVFDIILNISNINDIFSKDINNNLLILIEKKYKHKCYLSSFILKINKIINRSLLECNQNDLNCSFNISIQFEAECLIFSKNEIIMNMQITEKVNNNIILKNKATEDLPDIIISLIKNNLDMVKFNKGDILPIMVGKVKYSLGSDKITINSYPFIPLVSNNIKYKITQLEDSQLELLKETILNYINEEENIKQTILKTKGNTWDYFKKLVYPFSSKQSKDSNIKLINLLDIVNNSSKYNENIIGFDDRYDISECKVCIYNNTENYIKNDSYLILYELCKKYYLYLKLINDLSIQYNSDNLIKSNTKIFDLYNKYKK